MDESLISKLKATCLALLGRVRRARKPIGTTGFAEPDADGVPPSAPARPDDWLGCMAERGRITGDIVSAALDEGEWQILSS